MSIERTPFTDVMGALEEAAFLANKTGWPHALVIDGGKVTVMEKHRAYGRTILETVRPVE